MRWFFLIFWITLSVIAEASLPPGVIKGRVFDKTTLEPLPGVSILYKRNQGTTTDVNGNYIIKLPPGHFTIVFQHIGYETFTKNITLSSSDTIELNVGLEHKATEIDQLVISASKIEQRISELTVSLSVIEPVTLSTNHITDATELINKISGVEVLDGQASIRGGSGFNYGAGSRVLALVDGLPVLSADAGDIKWYSLPLENIAQIEVIKGASSVLYGSSALNGVINFRTADASYQPNTKFYLETGIFDNPRQQKWKWWNTPRTFSNISFSHLKRYSNTDVGINSLFQLDKGYRRLNDEKLGRVGLKLKQHNQKINGLSYGLNINSNLVNKTDFILWEDAEHGALKQSETTAIEMSAFFLTIDPYVSFKKNNRLSHDLRIRMQSIQNDFPTASNNNSTSRSIFSEYQFWYKIFDFLNVNAGILQYSSQIISEFYGDHNGQNFAGYSQLNMNPHNRLKIVAGGRLEYNALDGISDKPIALFRAGINYRVKDYTFFRASFGQGYRYPTIAEKYATTTLGAVRIYPNPYIKAESGWNSEIGIKQGILTKNVNGMLDFALFYFQYKDLIEYEFKMFPDGFGFRADNIEHSRVYGAEIEFNFNFPYGKLQNIINGGYVFMYPIEYNPFTNKNTDVFLKFRRKHSGKISISSNFQKFDLGLSFFAKSKILNIDEVFTNPETREVILPGFYDYWLEKNGGYFLIDLSTGYCISQNFKISFVIKNLSNTEYMGRPGDIMPHRNFSIRLSGNL